MRRSIEDSRGIVPGRTGSPPRSSRGPVALYVHLGCDRPRGLPRQDASSVAPYPEVGSRWQTCNPRSKGTQDVVMVPSGVPQDEMDSDRSPDWVRWKTVSGAPGSGTGET